jgi:hypothetical protein
VPGAVGHGFGAVFEARVARDLFRAVAAEHGAVHGSIALDGGEPGLAAGTAHLRWFILDGSLRGSGLGRRWRSGSTPRPAACRRRRSPASNGAGR